MQKECTRLNESEIHHLKIRGSVNYFILFYHVNYLFYFTTSILYFISPRQLFILFHHVNYLFYFTTSIDVCTSCASERPRRQASAVVCLDDSSGGEESVPELSKQPYHLQHLLVPLVYYFTV
jgi:hypothetical protein